MWSSIVVEKPNIPEAGHGFIHANVHNFLQERGIKLIDHPPYSPDLTPSDFWLFDEIKRR